MFTIDLRSSNIFLTEALRDHVGRRLDFALRRFLHRVEQITIRLVDINGPRGGPDKRCRIVVRLFPARIIVVEATDADAYAAVSQAAGRLEERIARATTRRRPRPSFVRRGGARGLTGDPRGW